MTAYDLTLWGVGTPRTMRAHWTLAEFGLDYARHAITSRSGETRTREYLALNPKHKIPTLQHGTLTLTESAAIAIYISETFPAPAGFFVPGDPVRRARLNEWVSFLLNELDASTYLMRRHVGLAGIYGEAPNAVAAARDNVVDLTGAVFGEGGPEIHTLLPEGMSVADILLTTCMNSALSRDIPLPARLMRYHERMTARPAYLRAAELNRPD